MKTIVPLILLFALVVSVNVAEADALDSAPVEETIIFGSYEQGSGQAPIEWIVLDRQQDRVLLLSKYTLESKPFHEVEDWDVTWADCTLRSWLNGDFLAKAFSEEERALIRPDLLTGFLDSIPLLNMPDSSLLRGLLFEIIDIFQTRPEYYPLLLKQKMLELLQLVFRYNLCERTEPSAEDAVFTAIREYIDRNAQNNISLFVW